MEMESALFRIIDETITGFLSCHPDLISIRIEWSDKTEARVSAKRGGTQAAEQEEPDEAAAADEDHGKGGDRQIPDALKVMIDEQRAGAAAVRTSIRQSQILALPASTWREVQQRAATIGATAQLVDDGREVVLVLANQ
jgi:hypothetical protein